MAVNVSDLKKGVLEVRHTGKDGVTVFKNIPIPAKLARQLYEAGAKKGMRKSEKGGQFDTLVVRLSTEINGR